MLGLADDTPAFPFGLPLGRGSESLGLGVSGFARTGDPDAAGLAADDDAFGVLVFATSVTLFDFPFIFVFFFSGVSIRFSRVGVPVFVCDTLFVDFRDVGGDLLVAFTRFSSHSSSLSLPSWPSLSLAPFIRLPSSSFRLPTF